MKIFLRVGWQLWRDPQLHYRWTAEQIWGPGLKPVDAKNRINGHMTRLRKEGVIKPLGGGRWEVDAALLAEKSGVPLPQAREVEE